MQLEMHLANVWLSANECYFSVDSTEWWCKALSVCVFAIDIYLKLVKEHGQVRGITSLFKDTVVHKTT